MILSASILAYGEGNAPLSLGEPALSPLTWAANVRDCAVLDVGTTLNADLLLALPADADELSLPEVCVQISTRFDRAENWWFVAPPPAEPQKAACAPPRHDGRPIAIPVHLGRFASPGYALITAVLQQPTTSTTPLVAPIHAAVAIVTADSQPPVWARSSSRSAVLPAAVMQQLARSYRTVRLDEEPEKEEYARRTDEGSRRYEPLYEWPDHSDPPAAALRDLLAPELLSALLAPTPAKLWPLLRTPSAAHPVHLVRVLSEQGAARLAAELAHAHRASPSAASRPTNNVSDTAGGREPERAVPSGGPPSLLMDEIRLQGVAHAMTAAVLAPLARLLFPEWTSGGQLDSYHAFTIHRRSHASEQENWFQPSSNSEAASPGTQSAGGAARSNTTAAARTGVHSDVCEVSLNLALRVSDDLQGSRVGFEPGFHGRSAEAPVLWLEHAAGHAFINLCQHRHGVDALSRGERDTLVLRGFASSFRRAPAERFYERCVAPAGAAGVPQTRDQTFSKDEL